METAFMRHWSRRASAVIAGCLTALFAVAIPGSGLSANAAIVIIGGFGIVELLCIRGFLMGVKVDEHGLEVINLLRRRQVEWPQIETFTVRGTGTEANLTMTLLSGEVVRLSGVAPAVWAPDRATTLASVAEALGRLLADRGR